MKSFICFFTLIMVTSSLFAMPSSETKTQPQEEIVKQEVLMNEYGFEYDSFDISGTKLKIFLIGHGTLMMEYDNLIIHIDPVSREANYAELPQADMILITHTHGDHLDPGAIKTLKKEGTLIIGTEESFNKIKEGRIIKNGEQGNFLGITITAVPAYNTTEGRDKFHPQGKDNGYILDFKGKRIYIAGDSEDTPEMMALTNIYIAFLPMNQPYTMTPEQVARAAKSIQPKILYPYHFGETDTSVLVNLLKDESDIEVRIRKLD